MQVKLGEGAHELGVLGKALQPAPHLPGRVQVAGHVHEALGRAKDAFPTLRLQLPPLTIEPHRLVRTILQLAGTGPVIDRLSRLLQRSTHASEALLSLHARGVDR